VESPWKKKVIPGQEEEEVKQEINEF